MNRSEQEDLQQSRAQLAAAFESVPVGIAAIGLDGRAIISNAQFRRFLPTGVVPTRDPEHIDRWRAWDDEGRLVDPQDWPSARALRGESVIPGLEMLFTDDEGREIWTNVATAPTYDKDGKVTGIVSVISDIDERKCAENRLRTSEQRAQTLLAELQHRVRNILAIIRSMIGRAALNKTDVDEFVSHLQGRVDAMARTQSILTRAPGEGVEVENIVRDEMLAGAAERGKVSIKGGRVLLSAKAAEVLALAVHELATNSIKYGALGGKGDLSVSWSTERNEGQDWLALIWEERGVPIENTDPPPGFGTELVTRRVPYELGGESEIKFSTHGVKATIRFPLNDGNSVLQTGAAAIIEEAAK